MRFCHELLVLEVSFLISWLEVSVLVWFGLAKLGLRLWEFLSKIAEVNVKRRRVLIECEYINIIISNLLPIHFNITSSELCKFFVSIKGL